MSKNIEENTSVLHYGNIEDIGRKKYLDYANFWYFFKSKIKEFPNLF